MILCAAIVVAIDDTVRSWFSFSIRYFVFYFVLFSGLFLSFALRLRFPSSFSPSFSISVSLYSTRSPIYWCIESIVYFTLSLCLCCVVIFLFHFSIIFCHIASKVKRLTCFVNFFFYFFCFFEIVFNCKEKKYLSLHLLPHCMAVFFGCFPIRKRSKRSHYHTVLNLIHYFIFFRFYLAMSMCF